MRRVEQLMRGLALVVVMGSWAPIHGQTAWGSEGAKTWAWNEAQSWYIRVKDPKGHDLWNSTRYAKLSYDDQTAQLLEHLKEHDRSRRAAPRPPGGASIGHLGQDRSAQSLRPR